MTITVCVVDINGGPKKDGSNCKKNAGKEASTRTARNRGAFWGRQTKQVPGTAETHVLYLLGFANLIGPSLVIRRDMRKVAMVARSKVLGKVLR